MVDPDFDLRVRHQLFAFLRAMQLKHGGAISDADIKSFSVDGERVYVKGQPGIIKPAGFEATLTISTTFRNPGADRPYDDAPGPDGLERYKWRGANPDHADNRGLRTAMVRQLPIVWFVGVATGLFEAVFPVYVIDEEPHLQQFVLALDDIQASQWPMHDATATPTSVERRYAERIRKERLHQPIFRERVLHAYGGRCALCQLQHRNLLEAAHIMSDSDGGPPTVTNGIAMCRLHHGAFDNYVLGISPELKIVVAESVMAETDGPTLRHAIQALNGKRIDLPAARTDRPNPEYLARRFDQFAASAS